MTDNEKLISRIILEQKDLNAYFNAMIKKSYAVATNTNKDISSLKRNVFVSAVTLVFGGYTVYKLSKRIETLEKELESWKNNHTLSSIEETTQLHEGE